MRRMVTESSTPTPTPTPTNVVTTDTIQTITADKTITANIYRAETGYELIPQNTSLVNGATGKRSCTLGSKIKVYINSSQGCQNQDNIEMYEEDYFILRYDASTTRYSFEVNTPVFGTVHWYLMDTTTNVIEQQGTIGNTITTVNCEPGYEGDFKLWFDYQTYVYSWSSNSDEVYRLITLAERGTKMYHHHIKVLEDRDEGETYYADVLSTHPESFEGEDWSYLAEARCVGITAVYSVDTDSNEFRQLYTVCGYDSNEPSTLRLFNAEGRVIAKTIEEQIISDTVTM